MTDFETFYLTPKDVGKRILVFDDNGNEYEGELVSYCKGAINEEDCEQILIVKLDNGEEKLIRRLCPKE